MLPTGDLLRVSLQLKLQLLSGQFGLSMSIDKKAQSRVTTLEEVIDPDHHEEIRLPLCHGSRQAYILHIFGTTMPSFNCKWQV